MRFKSDFFWGTATAAVQVEGAYDVDEKELNIWDVAPRRKIKHGANCHVACDHYHKYKEDIQEMVKLGCNSYRFSISWGRVIKRDGSVNEKGIKFYNDLIDELLKNHIEPFVSIYHWDLPQWIEEEGGWRSEKIIDYYLAFVKVCMDNFSDRVKYWFTFNEPLTFIIVGHVAGLHAPFKHLVIGYKKIVRHYLLCHGKAVKLMRECAHQDIKIGLATLAGAFIPDSLSAKDIEFGRHQTFDSFVGHKFNTIFADPALLGVCPQGLRGVLSEEDLAIIKQPLDFLGVNTYYPINPYCKDNNDEKYVAPTTSNGWKMDGRCLYWALKFYYERYHLPIIMSENGCASDDQVSSDGCVHDELRVKFIKEYLHEFKKLYEEGTVPLLGYTFWSLMDNFEWADGYASKFGLLHVDFETQKRTWKDSAYLYQKIVQSNGEAIE